MRQGLRSAVVWNAVVVLLSMVAALVIVWLSPTKAHGQEYRWTWSSRVKCGVGYDGYYHCRRVRYRVRSYGYYGRDEDQSGEREECLSRPVEIVSTEHSQEEHARDAARKLWMAKVQWRDGGQYMDLENAAEVRWRCGPSSAMDTISGRISEAAGKLVGHDGQNVRCELWARPCRASREKDDHRGRR